MPEFQALRQASHLPEANAKIAQDGDNFSGKLGSKLTLNLCEVKDTQ